ncbi:hypothetical protein [Evansella clarkii]|uniref:hypothetical protein n=1 Tax=Evansella clarkii TaxID=79879 RepID=UPI000B4419EC|nr:hypothetical protein [Evansella clarkii]
MSRFKSTYKEWYLLSFLHLSMGGTVAFAIFLHGKPGAAAGLFLLLLTACIYWWKQVYEYNQKLDRKAHLYVETPLLNEQQKHFFVFGFREDLNYPKKRVFYFRENARKVFYHFEHKIQNDVPLNKKEQYILNMFLIGQLDLSMIYFRFEEMFKNKQASVFNKEINLESNM